MKKRYYIVSFLLVLLVGCGSQQTKTEYIERTPPAYLLEDCDISYLEGETVRDLVIMSYKNLGNLKKCNVRNQGLRDWYKKREQ